MIIIYRYACKLLIEFTTAPNFYFIIIIFKKYLFIYFWEGDRETESGGGAQRERESQAGYALSA